MVYLESVKLILDGFLHVKGPGAGESWCVVRGKLDDAAGLFDGASTGHRVHSEAGLGVSQLLNHFQTIGAFMLAGKNFFAGQVDDISFLFAAMRLLDDKSLHLKSGSLHPAGQVDAELLCRWTGWVRSRNREEEVE